MIRIINSQDSGVMQLMERQLNNWEREEAKVQEIISVVRKYGDEALCRFTHKFDGVKLSKDELRVKPQELEEACRQVDEDFMAALTLARQNITTFHQKQMLNSWVDLDSKGVIRGQLIKPLLRVGIYVPGGRAAYPSSVLMNAIPAKVAGVPEIVMVTPPAPDGRVNPYTLVAAKEAGITEIYKVGGAQAIAALAYGTQSIKPVDKITGPGNIYVTLAKKQVYGQVDIDMLAGPSEVMVVADKTGDPAYIAADLLSQAEHDPLAAAILLTPEEDIAREVAEELKRQLLLLPRKEVAEKALSNRGAIVITSSLVEAVEIVNRYAPEHCELLLEDPFTWLDQITNAGAIFLGYYSPEPLGDYLAGSNHILPTGGTARWASGLGVDAFLKKTSIIFYSFGALKNVGQHVVAFSRTEGLDAHARAVEVRLGKMP